MVIRRDISHYLMTVLCGSMIPIPTTLMGILRQMVMTSTRHIQQLWGNPVNTDTIANTLGYIVLGVLGAIVFVVALLLLWLYFSRNCVLFYCVIRTEMKYPNMAVDAEYKKKRLWWLRIFLHIFTSLNLHGSMTLHSKKYHIKYDGIRVRWKIY